MDEFLLKVKKKKKIGTFFYQLIIDSFQKLKKKIIFSKNRVSINSRDLFKSFLGGGLVGRGPSPESFNQDTDPLFRRISHGNSERTALVFPKNLFLFDADSSFVYFSFEINFS